MTLGQLARVSGRGALVLREMEINEAGPNYVHIKGRSSGLLSWLCSVVGIDTTTVFDVYEDRIEYSGGSLSGSFTETIPLTRISNLGTGYLKPFGYITAAVVCLFWALFSMISDGASEGAAAWQFILAIIFFVAYFLNRSMVIYVTPVSSSPISIAFKRSVIEGVNVDEKAARAVISLIVDAILGSVRRT